MIDAPNIQIYVILFAPKLDDSEGQHLPMFTDSSVFREKKKNRSFEYRSKINDLGTVGFVDCKRWESADPLAAYIDFSMENHSPLNTLYFPLRKIKLRVTSKRKGS